MGIKVEQPGLATTVQDRGRTGYYHLGVPQGGALDQYSYEIANALVGNREGEAVLETAYLGPELISDSPVSVAITGAPVEVKVNDSPAEMWRRIDLQAGDKLSFGLLSAGTRYFISVAGGFDVPVVLGSRSTYQVGSLGGFHGRKLEAGDLLPVGTPGNLPNNHKLPASHIPEFSTEQEIRIVLGLYDHRLTEEGLENLTQKDWTLTPVADRMGMRYEGPGVSWVDREQPFGAGSDLSNIVDAGYAMGSIQIPGGTQPIVLHREAVSGGGYAMVGTVISADMDVIARAAPGTKTRFVQVCLEEAVKARQERKDSLEAALASLA